MYHIIVFPHGKISRATTDQPLPPHTLWVVFVRMGVASLSLSSQPAPKQTTPRRLINYESPTNSLVLFITSAYNLNLLIFIHLCIATGLVAFASFLACLFPLLPLVTLPLFPAFSVLQKSYLAISYSALCYTSPSDISSAYKKMIPRHIFTHINW